MGPHISADPTILLRGTLIFLPGRVGEIEGVFFGRRRLPKRQKYNQAAGLVYFAGPHACSRDLEI